MSIQFGPQTLFHSTEIDWKVSAAAWRGTVLEVYSRAEQSFDQCIVALEQKGWELGSDAHHPGPAARVRTLREFLDQTDFTTHSAACVKMLDGWQTQMAQRALFAHGAMSITEDGIALSYYEHKGKQGVEPHEGSFNRIEMLTFLKCLSADQDRMHKQLGQIRAAAQRHSGPLS